MKYRSIANGSVVDDVPPALVGVLYEAIEEEAPATPASPPAASRPKPKPKPQPRKKPAAKRAAPRKSPLRKPEKPLETVAHAEVLTTETAAPLRAGSRRKQ